MKYKKFVDGIVRKSMVPPDPSKRRLHMCERNVPFSDDLFNEFLGTLKQEDFVNYPTSTDDLKDRISRFHFKVGTDRIFIGHGSDSVLSTVFNLFVTPGSKVLMPEAHFPMYDVYLQQNQGVKETLKYRLDENGLLCLDTNFDESMLSEISLIVVGNPNSPVGDCLSYKELEKLTSYGIPLVIDQAYGEFGKTEFGFENIDKGVIFVNTFSKAWGAAGCRVGYAIASAPIVDKLNRLKPMFELSEVSKKFALFLMNNNLEVAKYIDEIIIEREFLGKVFPHVRFGNWIHVPSDFPLVDPLWEIKSGVSLPRVDEKFSRISIFSGMYSYLYEQALLNVRQKIV